VSLRLLCFASLSFLLSHPTRSNRVHAVSTCHRIPTNRRAKSGWWRARARHFVPSLLCNNMSSLSHQTAPHRFYLCGLLSLALLGLSLFPLSLSLSLFFFTLSLPAHTRLLSCENDRASAAPFIDCGISPCGKLCRSKLALRCIAMWCPSGASQPKILEERTKEGKLSFLFDSSFLSSFTSSYLSSLRGAWRAMPARPTCAKLTFEPAEKDRKQKRKRRE